MPALSGRELIEFASAISSKSLTISSNAIPVYFPATQTVTLEILDNTSRNVSKAVSVSTGTVKASAGTLLGWLATTSGDINIMDGLTSTARVAVIAGVATNLGPFGLPFTTSISISASAAAATYIYK